MKPTRDGETRIPEERCTASVLMSMLLSAATFATIALVAVAWHALRR
jgi:hypothetical protein